MALLLRVLPSTIDLQERRAHNSEQEVLVGHMPLTACHVVLFNQNTQGQHNSWQLAQTPGHQDGRKSSSTRHKHVTPAESRCSPALCYVEVLVGLAFLEDVHVVGGHALLRDEHLLTAVDDEVAALQMIVQNIDVGISGAHGLLMTAALLKKCCGAWRTKVKQIKQPEPKVNTIQLATTPIASQHRPRSCSMPHNTPGRQALLWCCGV
jgi:hypothetical protein